MGSACRESGSPVGPVVTLSWAGQVAVWFERLRGLLRTWYGDYRLNEVAMMWC